jgi:hypothetical protein
VTKFANLTNDSNWEMLEQRRKIAHICALYKAYSTEPAWDTIGDRLQRPYYLSQVQHDWKIRNWRQRMDIGKYSNENRTTQFCNKLPMNALRTFPSKPSTFMKRVWKVVSEVKGREYKVHRKQSISKNMGWKVMNEVK